ncbi:hypothetical protein T440DRAFT_484115 [Plenodomus tracheiphilus IPT5]|uniref:Uncharacterized protein n=1 Tax=Plenodomus tracheiphilus IPT5 TaxID=1408161 RepID=A0A6A7AMV7_9PLEO|nr:hypothetical protein T440DRAFT_484115 [Plenodomus tracheiphilus IPT5]
MSTPSAINSNSFAALCDGIDTTIQDQPFRPSGSVLRARRRTLFGAQLPSSAVGNVFADLYSADGQSMTFCSLSDLQRVAGTTDLPLDFPEEITYPQTVELNFPWCIGAPGQQRDVHFAMALSNQLMATPSTSRLDPGPADLLACTFTGICRRKTTEYDVAYAVDRALRDISTTPIFKHPKVWMMPVKEEHVLDNGDMEQVWYPWQVCGNCIAVRAKVRCSLWYQALQIHEPLAIYKVKPGQESPLDVYAWFSTVRDSFLSKDIGYYGLWECRDGEKRLVADA